MMRSFKIVRLPFLFTIALGLVICPILGSILGSTFAYSQSQTQTPAVVTFTLDFPNSQPEHYSIRVQSDGTAHYQSSGRLSANSDETDNFDLDFNTTGETRLKIFGLAAKAGYFQKDVDSHRKNIAFSGKKTLGYKDAQRTGESTYIYSSNAAVEELTGLMQSLSVTLEFGHRLQYDRRFQKLALDEELKQMEQLARSNELVEVTVIRPILDQIIADPSVMNVTRARAQQLLERAGVR
jgi:hypothetical protein